MALDEETRNAWRAGSRVVWECVVDESNYTLELAKEFSADDAINATNSMVEERVQIVKNLTEGRRAEKR